MKNWDAAKVAIMAAREAGLRLRAVGGQLRAKPEELITPGLRLQLTLHRAAVVDVLEYLQRQAAARRAERAATAPASPVVAHPSEATNDGQEPAQPAGEVEPESVVEAAGGAPVAQADAAPAALDVVADFVPDISPDSAPALDQQPAVNSAPALTPAPRPDRDPPWPRGPQHCMTCWGTRFVDLRDGRRWACFTCAAPEPGDVIAECANGPERQERTRASARGSPVPTPDRATQSQASCGGEVTGVANRPDGAGSLAHEVR